MNITVICKMVDCIYCEQSGKKGNADEFTCGCDEITISPGKNKHPECEEFELGDE